MYMMTIVNNTVSYISKFVREILKVLSTRKELLLCMGVNANKT